MVESEIPPTAVIEPEASESLNQPAPQNDAAPGEGAESEPARIEPPVPERVKLQDYQLQTLAQLYDLGVALGLRVGGSRSKHQLVFEILAYYSRRGTIIEATGILEIMKEGTGMLRDERFHYMPYPDDIFVPPGVMKRYPLRPAQHSR